MRVAEEGVRMNSHLVVVGTLYEGLARLVVLACFFGRVVLRVAIQRGNEALISVDLICNSRTGEGLTRLCLREDGPIDLWIQKRYEGQMAELEPSLRLAICA